MKSCIEAAKTCKVSLEEAWSELEREIQVRVRIYDGWVDTGKLSWADARDRLARMGEAARLLKQLVEAQPEDPLGSDNDGAA